MTRRLVSIDFDPEQDLIPINQIPPYRDHGLSLGQAQVFEIIRNGLTDDRGENFVRWALDNRDLWEAIVAPSDEGDIGLSLRDMKDDYGWHIHTVFVLPKNNRMEAALELRILKDLRPDGCDYFGVKQTENLLGSGPGTRRVLEVNWD